MAEEKCRDCIHNTPTKKKRECQPDQSKDGWGTGGCRNYTRKWWKFWRPRKERLGFESCESCKKCEFWESEGGKIGLCAEREEYTSDDYCCHEFKKREPK